MASEENKSRLAHHRDRRVWTSTVNSTHSVSNSRPTFIESVHDRVGNHAQQQQQHQRHPQQQQQQQPEESKANESVLREVANLERAMRNLKEATDALTTENVQTREDCNKIRRDLEKSQLDASKNKELIDQLNQQLQDRQLTIKDKDILCSTLAKEVQRLRALLVQQGVDSNEDDASEISLDEMVDEKEQRMSLADERQLDQRKARDQDKQHASYRSVSVGNEDELPCHESDLRSLDSAASLSSSSLSTYFEDLASMMSEADHILHTSQSVRPTVQSKSAEIKRLHVIVTFLHEQFQKVLKINRIWKEDYSRLDATRKTEIEKLECQMQHLRDENEKIEMQQRGMIRGERKADDRLLRLEEQKRLAYVERGHCNQGNVTSTHVTAGKSQDEVGCTSSDQTKIMHLQQEVDWLRKELQIAKRNVSQFSKERETHYEYGSSLTDHKLDLPSDVTIDQNASTS